MPEAMRSSLLTARQARVYRMGKRVADKDGVIPATIRRAELLGKWPEHVQAELCAAAEMWRFSKGETVLPAGEPTRALLILAEGTLLNERTYVNGRHMMTAVLRPGWPLKIASIWSGQGVPFGLTARSDCSVVLVPSKTFREVVDNDLQLLQQVTAFIGKQYQQDIISLQVRTMASLECQLALIMVYHMQPTMHLTDNESGGFATRPLDITQEEIAAILGCSRQKINVMMKQMEHDGLIQREGRRVRIADYLSLLELIELDDPVDPSFRKLFEVWQEQLLSANT